MGDIILRPRSPAQFSTARSTVLCPSLKVPSDAARNSATSRRELLSRRIHRLHQPVGVQPESLPRLQNSPQYPGFKAQNWVYPVVTDFFTPLVFRRFRVSNTALASSKSISS